MQDVRQQHNSPRNQLRVVRDEVIGQFVDPEVPDRFQRRKLLPVGTGSLRVPGDGSRFQFQHEVRVEDD